MQQVPDTEPQEIEPQEIEAQAFREKAREARRLAERTTAVAEQSRLNRRADDLDLQATRLEAAMPPKPFPALAATFPS
jgi:hypothetical protein